MEINLHNKFLIQQVMEGWEFLGYETRNKYRILSESGQELGFAAEQQKGIFGFFMRQFLGHWRTFDVHFFDYHRKEFMIAHHPFCFLFQRLDIQNTSGKTIGSLQQRFSILSKRFDVLDSLGNIIMEVNSPIWKPWTFPFLQKGKEVALILKKFSGVFSEFLTDRDNFMVEFKRPDLTEDQKKVILAASIFIDLIYFEKKADSD